MASSDRFPGCHRTSCVISSPLGLVGSSILDFWVCPSGHHTVSPGGPGSSTASGNLQFCRPRPPPGPGATKSVKADAAPDVHREAPQMVGAGIPWVPLHSCTLRKAAPQKARLLTPSGSPKGWVTQPRRAGELSSCGASLDRR